MQAAQWMKGTEGNNDYMVFAINGMLQAGAKPVLEPAVVPGSNEYRLLLGVRVRVAAVEGATVLNAGHTAQTTFTTFQFTKVDDLRASAFIGSVVPAFPADYTADQLMENLDNGKFFEKVLEMLTPIVECSEVIVGAGELMEFFKKRLHELMLEYSSKSTHKQAGKLIPFPTLK